jgi:hypothetical protein
MGFRRFHKADQTLQLPHLLDAHPGLKSADDAIPIREQAITGQCGARTSMFTAGVTCPQVARRQPVVKIP